MPIDEASVPAEDRGQQPRPATHPAPSQLGSNVLLALARANRSVGSGPAEDGTNGGSSTHDSGSNGNVLTALIRASRSAGSLPAQGSASGGSVNTGSRSADWSAFGDGAPLQRLLARAEAARTQPPPPPTAPISSPSSPHLLLQLQSLQQSRAHQRVNAHQSNIAQQQQAGQVQRRPTGFDLMSQLVTLSASDSVRVHALQVQREREQRERELHLRQLQEQREQRGRQNRQQALQLLQARQLQEQQQQQLRQQQQHIRQHDVRSGASSGPGAQLVVSSSSRGGIVTSRQGGSGRGGGAGVVNGVRAEPGAGGGPPLALLAALMNRAAGQSKTKGSGGGSSSSNGGGVSPSGGAGAGGGSSSGSSDSGGPDAAGGSCSEAASPADLPSRTPSSAQLNMRPSRLSSVTFRTDAEAAAEAVEAEAAWPSVGGSGGDSWAVAEHNEGGEGWEAAAGDDMPSGENAQSGESAFSVDGGIPGGEPAASSHLFSSFTLGGGRNSPGLGFIDENGDETTAAGAPRLQGAIPMAAVAQQQRATGRLQRRATVGDGPIAGVQAAMRRWELQSVSSADEGCEEEDL